LCRVHQITGQCIHNASPTIGSVEQEGTYHRSVGR
jgi:hypothetical protein